MSFCHKCGSPIASGDAFCSECGATVLSAAPAQPRSTNAEQSPCQQPSPAPSYAPQPAYTLQHKPVSKANSFGLVALILVGVALLLNIVGTIGSYGSYPSDAIGELIFRIFLSQLIPFALSAFVPLMTHILVKTASAKAAKPLMIIVLCMLGIQVLSAVFYVIHFSSMMSGNALATPLYSFVGSINGAEFIRIPYYLITRASRGFGSVQSVFYLVISLCADILYIIKNVLSLLGLNKLSRS